MKLIITMVILMFVSLAIMIALFKGGWNTLMTADDLEEFIEDLI